MIDLDYVLPLRCEDDTDLAELTGYLRWLSRHVRVLVVDGSSRGRFSRNARLWGDMVHHLPPHDDLVTANGKVAGVITGVRESRAEHVVIADDDVRYDAIGLTRIWNLLQTADLVRPQNFFSPLPWHARWDTARALINRAFGGDYPGTFGVRRSFFLTMGGYDGDVLFENLELIRTVRAHAGREQRALGLYVRRVPPRTERFWSQRVRQAYDDLAQPLRMAAFLAVLPGLAVLVRRHNYGMVGLCAGISMGVAELGRRRAAGRGVFPASCLLYAPAWVLERAVCSWLALAVRLGRGGIRYSGNRIRVSAHSSRQLRRCQPGISGSLAARKPVALCEPSQNGFVAERPHRHKATVALPGSMGRPF
ncbi:hypothetical protein GCM10023194_57010 [Planotetraspora phitsanulokensis]|uniref:Uncharacterized protein n=1 Tax=Planotetraspora phitsanulokensis TaxID=575192 RepID=A0A8J3UD61_9ACTN|nr:hypothetical protein Pph01_80610 [Planotetraspora phitsanulokensis]